jgi:hypothetical protein
MGASSGAPTMGAGAGANLDLMSNANLAQMPDASFSAGMGGSPQFGAFNSVDMAGSMPSTQMADFSGGMPTTPAGQAAADVTAGDSMMDKIKAGFGGEDAKKLAKDLAGASQQKAPQMTAVNTQASGAGGGQLPNYYAAMMGAPQPSGAMQAIQGSMPQMQQPMGIMGRI